MNMATIFAESRQMPHIPRVVQELIETMQDENVDIDKISKKVALDQSLTAKVLRLANSAHYGVPRTVSNPQDAVVLLGFSTLRTMVLASGMTGAFKVEGFDQKAFWKNAFGVAAISKWLASYVPACDKDTAFTCGMVHSMGSLLMRMCVPEESSKIDNAILLSDTPRHTVENSQLGFNYADVGAELARRWKFPEVIQVSIAEQNNPRAEGEYFREAGLIYIAKYLKKAHDKNFSEEEIISGFPLAVAERIDMDIKKAYADVASIGELNSGLDGLLE
ncbi:MAG: HDOD domain-containing protein [Oleibacter sp.]|nr:HDOD domain-containing protein [Thalassolituus sp.]